MGNDITLVAIVFTRAWPWPWEGSRVILSKVVMTRNQ